MGVFVFGESHVEYALVMECLLRDFDKLPKLIAKAEPDERELIDGLITHFSNKALLADYLQCISTFKKRIKEFYEPLKELAGGYNLLFIEGELTRLPGGVLECHLKNRGLDVSLFDNIIDLDYSKKPVESYWREKIVDNLVGIPGDSNIFIKVGANHVDRLEFSTKAVIYKMDNSFMTEEFMNDAELIKELNFR